MFEHETTVRDMYPQLVLPEPMFYSVNDFEDIHPVELLFAQALHERGLVIYREPKVLEMLHTPDFYVYNPFAHSGKLVEITLMKRDGSKASQRTKERKERQIRELNNCGIPFCVLYRENLECMRRYSFEELF